MRKYFLACVLWISGVVVPSMKIYSGDTARVINVYVSPRMELLGVIELLSNAEMLITPYDISYKRDALEYFSDFKSAPAVRLFSELLRDEGFDYDAPVTTVLYLSVPPELIQKIPFTDYLKNRAGGEEKLIDFVNALRDFAHESKFMSFFEAHKAYFSQLVEKVNKTIDNDWITPYWTTTMG